MTKIKWIDLSENGFQLFLNGQMHSDERTFVVQEIIGQQQSEEYSTTFKKAGFSKDVTGFSAPVTLRNSLVISSLGAPAIMVDRESIYFENRKEPSPSLAPIEIDPKQESSPVLPKIEKQGLESQNEIQEFEDEDEDTDTDSEHEDLIFENILKLSADSPDELRAIDIDRLVDEAEEQNVKGPFIKWLLNQELQERTRKLLLEMPLGKTDRIEDFGEKIGGARKDTATTNPSHRSLQADTRPAWRRRYNISTVGSVLNVPHSRDLVFPSGQLEGKFFIFDNKTGRSFKLNYETRLFATEEIAEEILPLLIVSQKHKVTRKHCDKEQPEIFQIVRRVTDRKYAVIKDGFESEEAALRYLAEHAISIIEQKTRFDDSIHPQLKKAIRIGSQHRPDGADITSEEFHKKFGFRGVEFGNWNNTAERQHILNQAYDAFLDLSEILKVSPKDISFNGELAIGFGSRGHGLSGAQAHYERNYCVINLTKIKGAGALAHEWFHAMDHFLGRETGKASTEKKINSNGDLVYTDASQQNAYVSHGFPYRSKNKLPETFTQSFDLLMDTIDARKMEFFHDVSTKEIIEQRMSKELFKKLDEFRAKLEIDYTIEKYPYYNGKKNNLPATPEQLQRVDQVISKMKDGNWGEMIVAPSKKAKFPNYFNSATLELSVLLKEIRGKQGYSTLQGHLHGPIAEIHQCIQTKIQADSSLADAEEQKAFYLKVKTEYASEAWKMDQGATKDYWGTFHEISARAFEAFVFDKLKASGSRNDFLAYEKHNDLPGYKMFNIKPYPEGDERIAINAEFETVFDLYKQTVLGQETTEDLIHQPNSGELDDILQNNEDEEAIDSLVPGM